MDVSTVVGANRLQFPLRSCRRAWVILPNTHNLGEFWTHCVFQSLCFCLWVTGSVLRTESLDSIAIWTTPPRFSKDFEPWCFGVQAFLLTFLVCLKQYHSLHKNLPACVVSIYLSHVTQSLHMRSPVISPPTSFKPFSHW